METVKIFVGNIPDIINEAELHSLFSGLTGFISFSIIRDTYSGRSRGFGFLEVSGREVAVEAVRLFNGRELSGKKLILNVARTPFVP